MKITLAIVLLLVYAFGPGIHYTIKLRRWRALPDHNPHKPGDSE
jgi:hypothetical protein